MKITTLEHISLTQLLETFNLSFSDYFIPFKLSLEQLQQKIISEQIDLSISVGAYNDNALVGFILHGKRISNNLKTFYNAGTGVIPNERGQKLTKRMYEFCLPIIQSKAFDQGVLEVISNNTAAIPIYKSIGFKTTRNLPCYKGIPQMNNIKHQLHLIDLDAINWDELKSFWDWNPTWQNQSDTLNLISDNKRALGAYMSNKLVGYIIYNTKTLKVYQFAVHKMFRKQSIGSSLFSHASNGKPLTLINLDGNDVSTQTFLKHLKMTIFLEQYEMHIPLKKHE